MTIWKLKPCPFCGGEAGLQFDSRQNDLRDISHVDLIYWVACEKCGIGTPVGKRKALVIKKWNRREGK